MRRGEKWFGYDALQCAVVAAAAIIGGRKTAATKP